MIDPIKLAIEALESLPTVRVMQQGLWVSLEVQPGHVAARDRALTALRSIKPPCQMCKQVDFDSDTAKYCQSDVCLGCTNFDKFQALPPVNLTREKS
jgi:hypothetical protein